MLLIGVSCCFFFFNRATHTGGWGMFKSPTYFTTLYRHIPLYRTPIFTELFHRIPITARKHTDFGIDSILINVKKHAINGIILLHKFFLLKRFFSMSLRIIGYSIHYTKYHSRNQWFSVSILV